MSDWRLWDVNPMTGARQYWLYDAAEDEVHIRTVQDIGGILEANKAEYAMTDERARWGDGKRIARIPLSILDSWINEGIVSRGPTGSWTFNDDNEGARRLNDRDFLYFRTRPGRV